MRSLDHSPHFQVWRDCEKWRVDGRHDIREGDVMKGGRYVTCRRCPVMLSWEYADQKGYLTEAVSA